MDKLVPEQSVGTLMARIANGFIMFCSAVTCAAIMFGQDAVTTSVSASTNPPGSDVILVGGAGGYSLPTHTLAELEVFCPADAIITINNEPTASDGPRRVFRSPMPGASDRMYQLTATITRQVDGTPQQFQYAGQIMLSPGRRVQYALPRDEFVQVTENAATDVEAAFVPATPPVEGHSAEHQAEIAALRREVMGLRTEVEKLRTSLGKKIEEVRSTSTSKRLMLSGRIAAANTQVDRLTKALGENETRVAEMVSELVTLGQSGVFGIRWHETEMLRATRTEADGVVLIELHDAPVAITLRSHSLGAVSGTPVPIRAQLLVTRTVGEQTEAIAHGPILAAEFVPEVGGKFLQLPFDCVSRVDERDVQHLVVRGISKAGETGKLHLVARLLSATDAEIHRTAIPIELTR